jgi:hypothetical protein
MAISRKESWPQRLPRAVMPIKYLTENGFSIVRLCDLDGSVCSSPSDCRFLVQRDDAAEQVVNVRFAQTVAADLRIRRRVPLADDSIFWLVCAESCLANYLWEKDELPPDGLLLVDELPPDELMLGLHWQDRED